MKIQTTWVQIKPGEKTKTRKRAIFGLTSGKGNKEDVLHIRFEGQEQEKPSPRVLQLFAHNILAKNGVPEKNPEGYNLQCEPVWNTYYYQKGTEDFVPRFIQNEDPENNLTAIPCLNHREWWEHVTPGEVPELLKHAWIQHSGMPELPVVLLIKKLISLKDLKTGGFQKIEQELTGKSPQLKRTIHLTPKAFGRRLCYHTNPSNPHQTNERLENLFAALIAEPTFWNEKFNDYISQLHRNIRPFPEIQIPFPSWYIRNRICPTRKQLQTIFKLPLELLEYQKKDLIRLLDQIPLHSLSRSLSKTPTGKSPSKKGKQPTNLEILKRTIGLRAIPPSWIHLPENSRELCKIEKRIPEFAETVASQPELLEKALVLSGPFFEKVVRETAKQV